MKIQISRALGFNRIDGPYGWAWDQVHSSDQNDEVVNWTVPPAATSTFTGSIDEVRIYDRALSDGEIAWLTGRTEPFDAP